MRKFTDSYKLCTNSSDDLEDFLELNHQLPVTLRQVLTKVVLHCIYRLTTDLEVGQEAWLEFVNRKSRSPHT